MLQRWHGWGAAPQLFDRAEYSEDRARLKMLLGPVGFAAAARTTLNAHYTDPRIVRPMWAALADLGVVEGTVLEPGCGRGSFLAEAPDGYRVVGAELDPATARVAQMLADPRHLVVQADFAEKRLNPGILSASIGNVPFGRYALFDPEHNPRRRLPIHDHFVLKAVSALAPGGVAVLVTSRYTLDKLDGSARAAIGEHADFLGAVRLPGTAHQAEAGTQVVTDIVVLRARHAGDAPHHAPGWDKPPTEITAWAGRDLEHPVRLSRYYVAHPEQILGTVASGWGLHGIELLVTSQDGDLESALRAAIGRVAARSPSIQPVIPAGASPLEVIGPEAVAPGPVGRIERTETGSFVRLAPDGWEAHDPPKAQRTELVALVRLRDLASDLVTLEARPGAGDDLLDETRAELRSGWEAYVRRWGPVNRVKVSDSGSRSYPRMGGFRRDPGWPRVAALELYDEAAGRAMPASLLERRLVAATEPPTTVDDPDDALAVCIQQMGRVDADYLGELLGRSPDEAVRLLADRVYLDPNSREWVVAEEYLSGNVRVKLQQAERAAESDPSMERNAAALRGLVPRDVTADELTGTLGAPWIGPALVQDFARDLCPSVQGADEITVACSETSGSWSVNASSWVRDRMSADHEFGLKRFDALRLLESALNGRSPVVTMPGPDGKAIADPDSTAQAVDLAADLGDRFDTWLLHQDPQRSEAAVRVFNDRFNAHVARTYAVAAQAISAEGLRSDFQLRPHQRQAIARMVYGGNSLLAHPVGAGKTAEMIVGAMELRRLGVIRRPCFVVPNHMLTQFASDIVRLYPAAEVLAIDKDDVNAGRRAEFAARVRSHDWHAVVITHSSFRRWPVSPDVEASVVDAKVAALQADIDRLAAETGVEGGAANTLTKRVERRKANYTGHLKELRAAREASRDDHEFFFDEAGIDYLAVDEAHEFKNADITSSASRLRGVPVGDASIQAEDLAAKLHWLRENRSGRPYVTFATATPVSNTAAELWVMARYLRPDLLEELGISAFDSFRLAFCDTISAMELDATGVRFRRIERLSRYKNLPELARWWGEFTDVVTIDDLDLPRPTLAGGERRVVLVERSPELAWFMEHELTERADAIRGGAVRPDEDNFLKLSSHARMASFDWETFRGDRIDPQYSILAAAADRIADVYQRHHDQTYPTPSGNLHPRPGALQLVFSDLGTPKAGVAGTAYDRLRALLVDRGVPAEQIGFIHDHSQSDDAKARFFAACREGRIAVAVSSTPKMGIGTNVQDRLLALHHLDCPWRPSDIEQREGRILRQGNLNPEVEIYAYATKQSFAVHGWQTIERKASFIGQLMRADPNGPRVLEPDDAEALAYGQIKAIATGDPDFLQLATLEDEVARLERLHRSHHQENAGLNRRRRSLADDIARTEYKIDRLQPHAETIRELLAKGQPFHLVIGQQVWDSRAEAAKVLSYKLRRHPIMQVAYIEGTTIQVGWRPDPGGASGYLDLNAVYASVQVTDTRPAALLGDVTRIINRVRDAPEALDQLVDAILPDLRSQLARTESKVDRPFAHSDELHDARGRLTQLRQLLEERYSDASMPIPPPTSAVVDQAAAMRQRLESVTSRPQADLSR
jgi:N12 class adenine-specific DNA methylase